MGKAIQGEGIEALQFVVAMPSAGPQFAQKDPAFCLNVQSRLHGVEQEIGRRLAHAAEHGIHFLSMTESG